jgi:hypothetical protein
MNKQEVDQLLSLFIATLMLSVLFFGGVGIAALFGWL